MAQTIPVVRTSELSGSLRAINVAEISARVEGLILERAFVEGTDVKEGDVLYTIEKDRYQATYNQAEAELRRAQSQYQSALREYKRYQSLGAEGAVASQVVDTKRDEKSTALASVNAAKATLEAAKVDLDNTTITAPIDGRISRTYADKGQLVKPGTPPLLTKITQLDPIYATVNVSERAYLSVVRARAEKEEPASPDGQDFAVRLVLADGVAYPLPGKVDYIAAEEDNTTGTFEVRVVFPNPKAVLRPGQYAEVQFGRPELTPVTLIQEEAISQRQTGNFVFVVGEGEVLEERKVNMGDQYGPLREITDGLEEGERVVVSGLYKARSGLTIAPQDTPLPELPSTLTALPNEDAAEEPAEDATPGEDAEQ